MEMHPLPVGSFLGKVRRLSPNTKSDYSNKCLSLLAKNTIRTLDSRLQDFIGVNSNAIIQDDVIDLAKQFKDAGLDLKEEVRDRFESTETRTSESCLVKTAYARMLLVLGDGLCYSLVNRIAHRDMYRDEEYNFAMNFLKALNQDDKEQFIKETDCVNHEGLSNLAPRLIEIVGDDNGESGIYVFKTIVNNLVEQSNSEACTDGISSPNEAILRKQILALHVLGEINTNIPMNDFIPSGEILSGVIDKLVEMAVSGLNQVQRENAISVLNMFSCTELDELLFPESKNLLLQASGIDQNVSEKVF